MKKQAPLSPHRTCLGTGAVLPQAQLLRFVSVAGKLTPDPARRLPGRGAYCTPTPEAYAAAVAKRGFTRRLMLNQPVPPWGEIQAQCAVHWAVRQAPKITGKS